jgi:hypothetical protein
MGGSEETASYGECVWDTRREETAESIDSALRCKPALHLRSALLWASTAAAVGGCGTGDDEAISSAFLYSSQMDLQYRRGTSVQRIVRGTHPLWWGGATKVMTRPKVTTQWAEIVVSQRTVYGARSGSR